MLKDYLFSDYETGEEFLVECESLTEAEEIANTYFTTPEFIDEMSVTEGEWLGLDTY